jgi:hypothetical protein
MKTGSKLAETTHRSYEPYNVLTQTSSSATKTASVSPRDGWRSGRPKVSSR